MAGDCGLHDWSSPSGARRGGLVEQAAGARYRHEPAYSPRVAKGKGGGSKGAAECTDFRNAQGRPSAAVRPASRSEGDYNACTSPFKDHHFLNPRTPDERAD